MADIPTALAVAGLVAFSLLLPSSVFAYRGWRRRSRYLQLCDAATRRVDTADAGETVLCSGTATPTSTITTESSEKQSVLSAVTVDEWTKTLRHRGWKFAAHTVSTPGFTIQTDTGVVAVPADSHADGTNTMGLALDGLKEGTVVGRTIGDIALEVESFETVFELGPEDPRSDDISALEQRVGLEAPNKAALIDLFDREDGTRRYREVAIEPGDSVTVLGVVEQTSDTTTDTDVRDSLPAGPHNASVSADEPPDRSRSGEQSHERPYDLTVAAPEESTMLVSTLDAETLLKRYRWRYLPWLYLPLGIVVGSFFLTVAVLLV